MSYLAAIAGSFRNCSLVNGTSWQQIIIIYYYKKMGKIEKIRSISRTSILRYITKSKELHRTDFEIE
jgi:hypothetical protein